MFDFSFVFCEFVWIFGVLVDYYLGFMFKAFTRLLIVVALEVVYDCVVFVWLVCGLCGLDGLYACLLRVWYFELDFLVTCLDFCVCVALLFDVGALVWGDLR